MKQLSGIQRTYHSRLLSLGLILAFPISAETIKTAAVEQKIETKIEQITEQNKTRETDFDALLKESGLSFQPTKGFKDIDVEPEYVMPYEKRIISEDGELEVRYAIRPLNRIEIAYDDPHNSAPHPNDLFEMLFRTLTETLAGGSHVISRAYTADQARKNFNAGWASAGVFDISPDVSDKYKQAMMITIHHNDKADAYLLMLTNDLRAKKETIKKLKESLKFTLFEKGINQPEMQ